MGRIWDRFRLPSPLEAIYILSLCIEVMYIIIIYRWVTSYEFQALNFFYSGSYLVESIKTIIILFMPFSVGTDTWTCGCKNLILMFIHYSIGSLVIIIYSSQKILEISEQNLGELRELMNFRKYRDDKCNQLFPSPKMGSHFLNYLQNSFQCCGLNSYRDWKYPTNGSDLFGMGLLPDSCCNPADRVISDGLYVYCSGKVSTIYPGCLDRMKDFASGWQVQFYFLQLSAALLIQALIRLALYYRKHGNESENNSQARVSMLSIIQSRRVSRGIRDSLWTTR